MSEFFTLLAVMFGVLFSLAVLVNYGAWRYALIVAGIGAPVTAGLIAFSENDTIRSWATLGGVAGVALMSSGIAFVRVRRHRAEMLGRAPQSTSVR